MLLNIKTFIVKVSVLGYFPLIRYTTMSKNLLQCTIDGKRRRGMPNMQWQDNIVKWTGLGLEEAML